MLATALSAVVAGAGVASAAEPTFVNGLVAERVLREHGGLDPR